MGLVVGAVLVRQPGVERLGRVVRAHRVDADVPGLARSAEQLVELAVVEAAASRVIPVGGEDHAVDASP